MNKNSKNLNTNNMTNLFEILINAPQGLELYSPAFGKVYFQDVEDNLIESNQYPIIVIDENNRRHSFTENGEFLAELDTECILFPSKEHKSWDNWQEVLFKKGDIIKIKSLKYKEEVNIQTDIYVYDGYDKSSKEYIGYNMIDKNEDDLAYLTINQYEYATPEERDQFFKELNANGYKWNADTKQIEKIEQQYTPKYKVRDWIKFNDNLCEITNIEDSRYELFYHSNKYKVKVFINETDSNAVIATEQELINAGIKEKPFTIDDFKPFDKVLVRDYSDSKWGIELFERYDIDSIETVGQYHCLSNPWKRCIPYNDETKHLLGTTDDCPDKYKTW